MRTNVTRTVVYDKRGMKEIFCGGPHWFPPFVAGWGWCGLMRLRRPEEWEPVRREAEVRVVGVRVRQPSRGRQRGIDDGGVDDGGSSRPPSSSTARFSSVSPRGPHGFPPFVTGWGWCGLMRLRRPEEWEPVRPGQGQFRGQHPRARNVS